MSAPVCNAPLLFLFSSCLTFSDMASESPPCAINIRFLLNKSIPWKMCDIDKVTLFICPLIKFRCVSIVINVNFLESKSMMIVNKFVNVSFLIYCNRAHHSCFRAIWRWLDRILWSLQYRVYVTSSIPDLKTILFLVSSLYMILAHDRRWHTKRLKNNKGEHH